MSATVTGILLVPGGFASALRLRTTGPRHLSGGAFAPGEIKLAGLVNGAFAQDLEPGVWEMLWPESGEGKCVITVPETPGVYNYVTLIGAGAGSASSAGEEEELKIVLDENEMKALTTGEASLRTRKFAVIIQNPSPGIGKFYYFIPADATTADGFNVIADTGAYGRFFAVGV